MSQSDFSTRKPDAPWRPAGTGHTSTWMCLHCEKTRPTLGRRGVGIRMKCAICLKAREQS